MVVLIFLVILGLTFENLTRVTEDSLPLGLPTKVHPVEITSKRQENDEEDEDHHRNFNAACSAL